MDARSRKQIVIHDDSGFLGVPVGEDGRAELAKAAQRLLKSRADMISLCAAIPEICYYYPAHVGEVWGSTEGSAALAFGTGLPMNLVVQAYKVLTAAGVDPFGVAVNQFRKDGCTVLAKVRMNDAHHVAEAGIPGMASQFWLDHPEWRIGSMEEKAGGEVSFESYPCVGGPNTLIPAFIKEVRPHLLDYAVPQVREHRLAIVREFMQRYDLQGLTLNFLRTLFCVSFPSKNAHHLTSFVAECRKIVDETVSKRGKSKPILGAMVPWDPDFCRVIGLDVEKWIRDGLLDYVSPTENFLSDFRMTIEPWVKLASGTSCAVLPGITGATSFATDVCIPEEYEMEAQGITKVTRENIRALVHGFYAEGADGVSFFNFYEWAYHHLFPLPDICLPEGIKGKERRYTYLKEAPLYCVQRFLRLEFEAGSSERKAVPCRLHENLKEVDAWVRFKARHLDNIGSLLVDVNGKEVSTKGLSLIPHKGEGFLYAEFRLQDGMLRDGWNEIGFALREGHAVDGENVIVQEAEIRVDIP